MFASAVHPLDGSSRAGFEAAATLIFTLISSSGATAAAGSAADSVSSWTVSLDADVAWHRTTPAGVFVAGTKSGIVGLDGETGRTLWRIDDLHEPGPPDVLPRSPYALLRLDKQSRGTKTTILLDVTTGAEVWDSSSLGFAELYHYSCSPELDALLMAGKVGDRRVVVAVDLPSGHRLHEVAVPDAEIGSIFAAPYLFDTDTTLVTVSGEGLARYDVPSGTVSWVSPRLQASRPKNCGPLPSGTNQPERTDPRPLLPPVSMLLSGDGQRMYLLRGQTLYALDTRGSPLWRNAPELCDRCVQLAEAGDGVVARTMAEFAGNDRIVMLDSVSGGVRWEYPKAGRSLGWILKSAFQPMVFSNLLVDEGFLYVVASKHLERIDLATGASTRLGSTRIDEENTHLQLERVGAGFLITGQQELEWLDERGKSVRRVHYDPPGDVGKSLALLGGAAVMGAIPDQVHEHREVHGDHVDRVVTRVTFNPDPLLGASVHSFLQEYHASGALDSLVFMLADLDEAGIEGPALVAIDKSTGNTVWRIPMSKKPRFEIDPLRQRIYVVDRKTIHAQVL